MLAYDAFREIMTHPAAGPTRAEPVVLVPCSAGSSRQWKSLVEQLDGFDSLPLDLRGHGDRSRWHGEGPLSLAEEAAAIGEAYSGSAPFHLVGHSYGGAVALKFALCFPERLRSLTLIEPSCFHVLRSADGTHAHLLDEIRGIAEAVNRGVLCGDYRGGMTTFIDYWGGPGSWESLPEAKKAQFADLAVHIAHHFWGVIEEQTPLAAYAEVDVPTLILCGTRSPGPSRMIARLLADTLPHARHRTIRDAGHMSPLTHPTDVNPLIVGHILSSGARSEASLPKPKERRAALR
jgi:pimeloyl-ACP methyl ester carboxylesterase